MSSAACAVPGHNVGHDYYSEILGGNKLLRRVPFNR